MRIDRVRGHSFVGSWIDRRSTVVDLGMNEGLFSREMHERYGCRALGVEANPALAQKLASSSQLECFNYAIALQRGPIDFFVDSSNSEASSLNHADPDRTRRVLVEGMPFAEFLTERHVAAVDLLKVDIEGAEIDFFLETDMATFAHISQICVEFHIFLFEGHGAKVEAVLKRMSKAGFYFCDFSRGYEDVLLVNQALRPLGQSQKLSIAAQKYTAGVQRMVSRAAAPFK